ncbi:hypothetical protein [Halobaculum sp. D14]|uniref:hypothetical protein n=1 Tax=unclassified Halobaculum TaxID=2640896 RepID=UPI003EB9BCD0
MSADAPDEDGDDVDDATAHLDDVPTGAGCTEIWETLSEGRDEDADGDDADD